LLTAFILAVTALMLLPGPNVALITANSVSHGIRYGLLTVALTIDSLWAVSAHHAHRFLRRRAAWANRASGTILIGAGAVLAFARGK